jgi:diamine N-acetyltransferase
MIEPNIRAACAGDEEAICDLLRELAEYERLALRFRLTPEIVRRDFLGTSTLLNCDLAFSGDAAAGIMTWYPTYSSFAAQRGLYLEDFYVRPPLRRQGIGRKLLAALARRAASEGATTIQWAVLAWNEPSIRFYQSLHAERVDEWHIYRLCGHALDDLATA